MHITLKSPGCGIGLPVEATKVPREIRCGKCNRAILLSLSNDILADRLVDTCPVCNGQDFYIRKDFDPEIGLTVVIIGGLISAFFYYHELDLVAYSVLAVAALIDLVIYRRLGDLSVCYRCHTEFRGSYKQTASQFDLHTADVLELEYQRQLEKS
jgi:hypothetical protein